MDAKTVLYDKIRYDAWKKRKLAYDRKQLTKRIAFKAINLAIQALIIGFIGYLAIFAIPNAILNLLGW